MSKSQQVIAIDQVNVTPPPVRGFVSESTILNMQIEVYPYDASKADAKTQNLLADGLSGKHLRRSRSVNDLAARASTLRGRKPGSAQAWASKLARSLTSLDD